MATVMLSAAVSVFLSLCLAGSKLKKIGTPLFSGCSQGKVEASFFAFWKTKKTTQLTLGFGSLISDDGTQSLEAPV